MVRVIWRELRKVRVEAETAYGSDKPAEIVEKNFWWTLQAHWVMDDFLRTLFHQHTEVAPQITLYLFKHTQILGLKCRL